MKNKHFFTALFAVLVTATYGQSNIGVDYFGIGEYQAAKKYLEAQISQSPTAEVYYYLGEIAYSDGKADEAKKCYDKGLTLDPNYMLNYIGEGKLLLKTNQKEAEGKFDNALNKNKKDPGLQVAIARAYFENGMKDLALSRIDLARKYSKKSPLISILEGDMLQADRKFGESNAKYEEAIYFDPDNVVASVKSAQVFLSINPAKSVDLLKKVLAKHPDYKIAYRYLGKAYNLLGKYPDAIDAFNTFFAEKAYSVEDITIFASDYYFTDKFNESIALINEGIQLEPDNFVLNRLRMYNAAKTKDSAAISYADHFFSLPTSATSSFITKDYTVYAQVLSNAGQYAKSLEQYQKVQASDNDNKHPELLKDIASVYTKMGDNITAAETYQKYIDLVGADNAEAMDYYQLGRSYYYAGIAFSKDASKSEKTKESLLKADSIFAIVSQKAPDSYTGFLWRGHANAAMEPMDPLHPETTLGLAKPYYEAAINAILSKGNVSSGNKKDLIQAYRYLGYYYYVKNDKVNSTTYWNKILELDPTNSDATQVLDSFKAKDTKK
jgi:tetratricopeptide (TPR) repeat protein